MHTDPTPDTARAPLLQRLPTAVFIVCYGVLAIALIITLILLVAHANQRTTSSPQLRTVTFPAEQNTVDTAQLQGSVRPYLIAEAEVGQNYDGAMLRGSITEYATQAPADFSGHVMRLLEQNCVPAVVLESSENLHLNFWGFCHNAPADTTIAEVMDFAAKHQASFVSFYNYPSLGNEQRAIVSWPQEQDEADVEKLIEQWEEFSRPSGVDRITFEAFSPTHATIMDVDSRNGTNLHEFPRSYQD